MIDITAINSNGFHLLIYRPDNEVFSTSLYEIDYILKDQEEEEAVIDGAFVGGPKMPVAYSHYKDVSLKAASDILPLYWTYDYKITLNKPNTLSYSPLY